MMAYYLLFASFLFLGENHSPGGDEESIFQARKYSTRDRSRIFVDRILQMQKRRLYSKSLRLRKRSQRVAGG